MGREEMDLGSNLKKRCGKIKEVDVLVGVLCKNVETTVLHVLNVVNEGLYWYFPDYKKAIVISVGSSSDRTFELIDLFQPYNGIEKIVTGDRAGKGKGSGIRTIFEIAKRLNAKTVVLLDGDLLSIKPEWIEAMAGPVIYGRADLTIPYYIRDKYDGVITNILAYPFTRAVYGVDVRQPLAGEFGLSKDLYERLIKHPLFPLDFGVDIFIVTVAAAEGMLVKESLFAQKIHESTTRYLQPEELLIPMFRQVTGKMFELAMHYENIWKNREQNGHNSLYRKSFNKRPMSVKINIENFRNMFIDEFRNLKDVMRRFVPAELLEELGEATKDIKKFDGELWTKVVYNFASSYKRLEKQVDRYVLLECLKTLWMGRFTSYALEVKNMSSSKAEEIVQRQAEIFEKNFDYLVSIY